jgi:hypothetical protein
LLNVTYTFGKYIGVLVEVCNSQMLADALLALIESPKRRVAYGSAGLKIGR